MTLLLIHAPALPAAWLPQQSGSTAELRGLAVLDATHAWAAGAGGTVLRTRDGDRWEKLTVPGGEALDFRDVEALGGDVVVLMAAGSGDASRIYRSTDGGRKWTLSHTNPEKEGFYDAIAFWSATDGLVLGDPVNEKFQIRVTSDGGRTWAAVPDAAIPKALPGEGAFAASGTCLTVMKGGNEAWFVTGGAKVSRVFRTFDRGRSWSSAVNPVPAANPSSGLFSIAFLDSRRGFTVGGDYKQPALAALNGTRTESAGRTFIPAPISAAGFYSAVVAIPGTTSELVAVGPGGTAASHDAGATWTILDPTPLNAVAFSDPRTGWAIGPKGTIVRWSAPAP